MRARFVTDTASVNINPVQVQGSVSVKSGSIEGKAKVKSIIPITEHDKLSNRNLPDQHPIEAITNLRDVLDRLWTFTYEQEIASDTWVVNHNLGRHPSFVVVDSAGSVQMPDEFTYNSDNQVTIKFISAFAGKAYFN